MFETTGTKIEWKSYRTFVILYTSFRPPVGNDIYTHEVCTTHTDFSSSLKLCDYWEGGGTTGLFIKCIVFITIY